MIFALCGEVIISVGVTVTHRRPVVGSKTVTTARQRAHVAEPSESAQKRRGPGQAEPSLEAPVGLIVGDALSELGPDDSHG